MMKHIVVSSKEIKGAGSGSSTSKRPYAAPCTEVILPGEHPVMVKASPGIGGPWNPGDDIDAKGFDALDYLPAEFNNPWGE